MLKANLPCDLRPFLGSAFSRIVTSLLYRRRIVHRIPSLWLVSFGVDKG